MKWNKGRKRSRAAATVEMAVVRPVLLTMLFGIIEFGWVFSVRQALTTAAREGARTAALPGTTEDDVEGRVEAYDLGLPKDLNHEFASLEAEESVNQELDALKKRVAAERTAEAE